MAASTSNVGIDCRPWLSQGRLQTTGWSFTIGVPIVFCFHAKRFKVQGNRGFSSAALQHAYQELCPGLCQPNRLTCTNKQVTQFTGVVAAGKDGGASVAIKEVWLTLLQLLNGEHGCSDIFTRQDRNIVCILGCSIHVYGVPVTHLEMFENMFVVSVAKTLCMRG